MQPDLQLQHQPRPGLVTIMKSRPKTLIAVCVVAFAAIGLTTAVLTKRKARSTTTQLDDELRTFSNDLLETDTNVASAVYNLQGKLRTRAPFELDSASQPLFETLPADVLQRPSYAKLVKLLDNYDRRVETAERVTPEEETEMQEFIAEIIKTPVMNKVKEFLISKGKLSRTDNFNQLLYNMWFTTYSRLRNVPGSSAFEHVFVGEVKNHGVSGLHNWVQFYLLEKANDVNYHGFYVHLTLKPPVVLLKFKFALDKLNKPTSTMLVGSSPEFEIGLYTVCFLLKPGKHCPVKLGTKTFSIQTFTHDYQGKTYLGSAYPQLS